MYCEYIRLHTHTYTFIFTNNSFVCPIVSSYKSVCPAVGQYYCDISDSGCSEIRTPSLQRTKLKVQKMLYIPIYPIHFDPPKEDNLLTKDKIDCPKVSFT